MFAVFSFKRKYFRSIAYSIKNLRFGSALNFSIIELRKKYCKRELELNKNACGQIYLYMVKIVKNNGNYRLVNLKKKGAALEYAIKMKEIPKKLRLDSLLRSNKLNNRVSDLLTIKLVKFHNIDCSNVTILLYGRPEIMKTKLEKILGLYQKLLK